jgi:hypothetical protein
VNRVWAAVAVAVLAAAAQVGCAPYRMGVPSLYACNIRTVYVPMFESNSFRRNLGERLTEAVQKEIERRTPFKVVSTPDADSVLTGRIMTETKGVSVEAPTDEPRELTYYFTMQVSWVDKNGADVQSMQPLPLSPEMTMLFNTSMFYPEIGQSISTAEQDAISRLARQIVGMMEAPW